MWIAEPLVPKMLAMPMTSAVTTELAIPTQWLPSLDRRPSYSRQRRRCMRWLDIPGQTNRISAMEGLRAYAVALVFVFHATIIIEERGGSGPLLSWAKHGTYATGLTSSS